MKFITLDLESTGLSSEFHELTEIAILNNETMELVEWDIRIRHPERCSKEALMITNKTAAELTQRGRYLEDCIDEIDEFVKSVSQDPDEIVCVGHNILSFDRNWLEKKWKSHNRVWLANYYLCTMQMSKKFTKQILGIPKTSHSLDNMIKLAGLKESAKKHNSISDTQQAYFLYMYFLQRGIKPTEFIKLSPSLMENLSKPTVVKNSKRKIDFDAGEVLSSIQDETNNEQAFEEDNDD